MVMFLPIFMEGGGQYSTKFNVSKSSRIIIIIIIIMKQ